MGFSRQEHCSILPFSSPEDCILSEPSTVTCPSGVSLYSKTHSFIELDKVVVHLYTCVQEYPCVLFIPELKKRALGVFSKRCILSLPFPYMQSDLRNPHQKNKNKNKLVFKFFLDWIWGTAVDLQPAAVHQNYHASVQSFYGSGAYCSILVYLCYHSSPYMPFSADAEVVTYKTI